MAWGPFQCKDINCEMHRVHIYSFFRSSDDKLFYIYNCTYDRGDKFVWLLFRFTHLPIFSTNGLRLKNFIKSFIRSFKYFLCKWPPSYKSVWWTCLNYGLLFRPTVIATLFVS